MVLELARPSEAWGFPPGGKLVFQRFEWYPYTNTNTNNNNTFRGMVFSAREEVIFFEAVLLPHPQATEAVEKCCFSRISDDTLGSFWRGFGTSSSFRSMGFPPREVAFQRFECYPYTNTNNTFRGIVFSAREEVIFLEAVLLPHPQATEAVEKCCFSRISDDTLGSFWRGFGTSSSFRSMGFSPGR